MVQSLKRALYRMLAFSGIRAPVRLILELTNRNLIAAVGPVPTAKKVLVLAPHMDDETIGCGGAIRAHLRSGASVEVLFITDGAQGFEPDILAQQSVEQRREIRRVESEKAAAVLGVSATHYLDLADGNSSANSQSTAKFMAVMAATSPDLIYLPFLTDSHHDHATTNRLFLDACREEPALQSILLACYEVWTPLHPNCIVDITQDMETKLKALACYSSQLAMNDYLRSVEGLNAYRSIANRSQGYAEAFFLTTARDYLALAAHM